jgi:hypothetical protein
MQVMTFLKTHSRQKKYHKPLKIINFFHSYTKNPASWFHFETVLTQKLLLLLVVVVVVVVVVVIVVVVVVVVVDLPFVMKSMITDRICGISWFQHMQFGNPWCTLLYVNYVLIGNYYEL